MENMEIYNRFREAPQEALKQIGAGRLKGFTDINPMWRIKKLTEEFGPCGFGWATTVEKMWLEPGAGGVVAAFVQISLRVKRGGEWSEAIPGIGGASFVSVERQGPYTSDEAFKMAYTDAISVACKSLGMAADVYYAKDRTKYDQPPQDQPAPQPPFPPQDNEMLELALQEINAAQAVQTLAGIYNNYPMLQADPRFMSALSNKKKQFIP